MNVKRIEFHQSVFYPVFNGIRIYAEDCLRAYGGLDYDELGFKIDSDGDGPAYLAIIGLVYTKKELTEELIQEYLDEFKRRTAEIISKIQDGQTKVEKQYSI